MKVKYINYCKSIFLTYVIAYDMSSNVGLGGFDRYYSLVEGLFVLNAQAIFCWFLFC